MKMQYLSLEALSATLGLPHQYLRNLAAEGHIPFLDVNGRKRFSEREVREALASLAQKTKEQRKEKHC